jgi:hypothetical protein
LGKALEIATGAPIPNGANSVVMVEYTHEKNGVIEVRKAVTPGENVTAAGSDIMARGDCSEKKERNGQRKPIFPTEWREKQMLAANCRSSPAEIKMGPLRCPQPSETSELNSKIQTKKFTFR